MHNNIIVVNKFIFSPFITIISERRVMIIFIATLLYLSLTSAVATIPTCIQSRKIRLNLSMDNIMA